MAAGMWYELGLKSEKSYPVEPAFIDFIVGPPVDGLELSPFKQCLYVTLF